MLSGEDIFEEGERVDKKILLLNLKSQANRIKLLDRCIRAIELFGHRC